MPIDFSSSVNNFSNKVFGTSIINKYLNSTLFVSLLITFILMLIIMLFYPAKENTPIKIIFKVGLYSFLSSALILFLHDGVVKSNINNNKVDENNEKIIQNLTNQNRDIIYNNKIPVKPNIIGGDDDDLSDLGDLNNKPVIQVEIKNGEKIDNYEGGRDKPPKVKPNKFDKFNKDIF